MGQADWVSGRFTFNAAGVPLEFKVTVPANPVKPRRLLPVFQQMANSVVEAGARSIEAGGERISCKPHCGACCRQAVPISEMEIYHIADLVEAMPEPRRTVIRERFARAVDHFEKIAWFDRFLEVQRTAHTKDPEEAARESTDIIHEYFFQGIACPFLEDESCSIHPDRPVVCREYLVTSPPDECASRKPYAIKGVELPLKPSRGLKKLALTPNYQEYGMPILIQALELAEKYPEDQEERTGPEWMREFLEKLSGSESSING